jgi:drug/metabolite transporter (DMT)-like permease
VSGENNNAAPAGPGASIAYLVAAAVFWSTSGVLLKSIPSAHWLAIAGIRSLFSCLLFLPGLTKPRPPLRKLAPAIVIYAALVITLMGSMQLGTAAQGIWLQYIAPSLVAVWAWAILRQRVRPGEAAAVGLTILAVVLIATGGHGRQHTQSVLLGLASGVGFGLFVILLKTMGDVHPGAVYLWTNLGAAAIAIPLALALGVPLPLAPRELAVLAAMGIGQLGLGYALFQRGLVRTRAVEASLIVLLEPILNPVWVYLVLGEIPATRVLLGCGLIGLALVAMALSERGRPPQPRRP